MKVIWNSHFSVHEYSLTGAQPGSFLGLWLISCYKGSNWVVATKTYLYKACNIYYLALSRKTFANLYLSTWDFFPTISLLKHFFLCHADILSVGKMPRSKLDGRGRKWSLNITQQIGNLPMDKVPASLSRPSEHPISPKKLLVISYWSKGAMDWLHCSEV